MSFSGEDLEKLFKGANRMKSINKEKPGKNRRENPESEIETRKESKKGGETIRGSKEAEKPIIEEPITEKQEELERPKQTSALKGAYLPKEKEEIFDISNRKWLVEKAILDAEERKDTDRLRELRKEFWELNQQYQEASRQYHEAEKKLQSKEKLQTEIESEKPEIQEKEPPPKFTKEEQEELDRKAKEVIERIEERARKKEKPEAKPEEKPKPGEKQPTLEEKIKQKEREIEEAEQKMAIYRPLGWFRKKPVVRDLGYYAGEARLKELKEELKILKKGEEREDKTKEAKVITIKKEIPAIKKKLTLISKRFAKRDFGVIEQTKMEDEQKKLEKEKKKLEKQFKKLRKKLKTKKK